MTGKPVEEYVADTIGGNIPKGYVELVDPDDSSYIKLRYYGWMVMDDVGNSRDNVSNRLVVSVIESIPGHDREAYLLALEVYTSSGYHQFVLMISEDDTLFEPMTSLDDWE